MEKIIDDLKSWEFWFTAVFVGVMVHIVGDMISEVRRILWNKYSKNAATKRAIQIKRNELYLMNLVQDYYEFKQLEKYNRQVLDDAITRLSFGISSAACPFIYIYNHKIQIGMAVCLLIILLIGITATKLGWADLDEYRRNSRLFKKAIEERKKRGLDIYKPENEF
jgi:hypothetical protein